MADITVLRKGMENFGVEATQVLIDQEAFPAYDDSDFRVDNSISTDLGATDTVDAVFARTEAKINEYSAIALEALEALGTVDSAELTAPTIKIDDIASPTLDVNTANKPVKPNITIPELDDPITMRGELQDFDFTIGDLPEIVIPTETPEATLEWNEAIYEGKLFLLLKSAVTDIIHNGGRGLDLEFEEAVENRAMTRITKEHARKIIEAERYYASKGYGAPQGGLISRLKTIERDTQDSISDLNSDIVKQQYEQAREHIKNAMTLGVELERMSLEEKNNIENRALDAIKSYVSFIYENYKNILQACAQKVEIFKAQVEAKRIGVEAVASANKSIVDTYIAEIDAQLKRAEMEFSIVEQVVKIYVADLSGYETEVKAETTKLTALIDKYKADIGKAEAQGTIELGIYEQEVKAILGEIELRLGAQEQVGKISAQVASSALSAFNASASISESGSRSASFSESRGVSTSSSFARTISNGMSLGANLSESASDTLTVSATLTP